MAAEVYLNGKFVGKVDNPQATVQSMIEDRRKGVLPSQVNVSYHKERNAVLVQSSRGRLRRPLIVVKDGQPLLTTSHLKELGKKEIMWADLVKQGVIEYLDAEEEESTLVAFSEKELTKDHTHLEVTPLSMLSMATALVPYGNFNQSTRLNAGSKNQKQALGFYATNFFVRMDMDVNLLQTPQVPLVTTVIHDVSNYDQHPAGQNVVVAVMSYKGYNMEDAIILNRASVERGLGRSTYYRQAVAEELRYAGGLVDEVCIPDKDVKGYKTEKSYRFLEEDGIISPESKIGEGDVIIGKTSPPRFLSSMEEYSLAANVRRESSVALKHGEHGVVDLVLITENEEGNKLIQVRLREDRIPEIGDKYTSRHGQKGVIGLLVDPTDMPFSASGIIPDIVFSPHGIPSRMTISHLIEMVGGKAGALAGRFIDGTTFSTEPEEALRKELLSYGFREDGTETMYNGMTGEQYHVRVFIGDMYYLKLKHMVANKLHSRARGPIQLLTRQPTEGRAKEGGLRLGEMEKDTFVAHGASLLLKERFDADRTIVPVCENCGMVAVKDEYKGISYCQVCGDAVDINEVEMSYAFKLLLDEFKALGIYPKLELENRY
ncbi:DNA-directed RNA polymerase subunit B [Candidatus Woesearchaeota archaeon]|nr:DNA-directed RNA polymerase subunit B [Candidatus Woesearchaeota archaeon]